MGRKRGWGDGSIQKRGRQWRIRWNERGQRLSKSFPSEDLARRALARILGDIAAGRAGVPRDTRRDPTLAMLFEPWIERRQETHRSADDDEGRWRLHLAPELGAKRPDEVDAAELRRVVEKLLARPARRVRGKKEDRAQEVKGTKLSPATVRLCMRLLSTFYTDLVEQGHAQKNPLHALPKATRRLLRPTHDPKSTPFLERLEDIRAVFLKLPEPTSIAFAIGALAGLRTGEVLALRWSDIDSARGRIHVQVSTGGPLKDNDTRLVPLQAALAALLKGWRLRAPKSPLVCPPARGRFLDEHTIGEHLRAALTAAGLPRLTWYQATRHTFASQWVIGGGSIEELRDIMGHSTVLVTERYAHLRPGAFSAGADQRIAVDLTPAAGAVVRFER